VCVCVCACVCVYARVCMFVCAFVSNVIELNHRRIPTGFYEITPCQK